MNESMIEPRMDPGTDGPVDIALVRMPYGEISQPSLAVGLLKAACDSHGLSNRALAANLWFAEEIGPVIHDMIFEAYSTTLLGEWTFAGALFPDFHPDDDAYLRKAITIFELDGGAEWNYLQKLYPYLDYMVLLREIRRRAPDFIERTADRILALDPKIVGCSSTFQQHCASLSLLRAIKQRRPEVVTMIGGANCEGDLGRATFEQFPFVDFVVSGEADGFFGPMCETILQSGADAVLADLPAGVWAPHHRRDQGSIERACEGVEDGAPIARLEDMNDSPIPNYDDYFSELSSTTTLGKYLHPALPFQTARGCWWGEKTHCTFCGISRTAMKFRAKTPDDVMEQMLALRDKYGISTFQGTEYIFDYRFFNTLLPRLKELNSHFRFEVKANLKVEQLAAFIDSGTIEVQPGVESLQDDLLGLLKKGVSALQNVLLLKRGRQIGLMIYYNLLHTIPNDRDEWYGEIADVLPLLTHLQPPASCSQIHYDRFSPYWKNPAEHGLTLMPAFGYAHVYPFPPETLKDMAYFFETPRQRDTFLQYDPRQHPGLLRMTREVYKWKTAFAKKEARPKLEVAERGDKIVFEDTREVAVAPGFEIEGLEAKIYRVAEHGIAPAHLMKKLQSEGSQGPSEEAVQEALQSLIAKKVLVSLSGRYLSLGLTSPVPPYLADTIQKPKSELSAIWGKVQADRLLDERRPSIALSCIRTPQAEPLSRWLATAGRRRTLTVLDAEQETVHS
jgi:ribosomal peptide maturation radical SAM protein 1